MQMRGSAADMSEIENKQTEKDVRKLKSGIRPWPGA